MNNKEFLEVIDRYLSGTSSREEAKLVERFCEEMGKKPVDIVWTPSEKEQEKRRIFYKIQHAIKAKPQKKTFYKLVVTRWSAVAAVLLLFFATLGVYRLILKKHVQEMLVFETGIGEHKHLKLDDGTEVWLNDQSQLVYPKTFYGRERSVELKGEAFFEVAKDPHHPFKVKAGQLTTTVLGTSFNIRGYSNDRDITVGVATGKVKVSTSDQRQADILLPGQLSILSKSNLLLTRREIAIEKLATWRTQIFTFDNIALHEVLKILERRYNVSFRIESNLGEQVISGQMKFDELDMLLRNLCFLTDTKFLRIDNKQFVIKKM